MNRIDLDGRAAAVTGGATGIGYATVARLLDSGAAVARALGESVADLLRQAEVASLFITGGDTAAAVLAALGRTTVELVGEVEPGVPLGRIDRDGGTLRLITKAGGFGAEDLLVGLAARLAGRGGC